MNETYYEIDEKAKKVLRLDKNGMTMGALRFSSIRALRIANEHVQLLPEDPFFVYLIAYDELVDRGLIKENE